MRRRIAILLAVAGLAAFGAAGARADGLPVLGVDVGSTGVVSHSGNARYVTMPGGLGTVVAKVDPRGGRILASTVMPGTFTIPAVAYDGSAGGLSADGRTLVLIEPRQSFPRSQTELMVVNTRFLRSRRLIALKGDFSFDAVSPDGSLVYLIQYTDASDPNVYAVRVYDVRSGKLAARPVTDPRERGAKMGGRPLTRATSPDGRWAYTLYDGNGRTPFVHALDTSTRSAHCIDLPTLGQSAVLWNLRFRLDPAAHRLTLVDGPVPAVAIDTRTFATSVPKWPVPPGVPAAPSSGTPWLLVALSTAGGLALAAALLLVVRRRGAAVTRPSRSPVRAS